MLLLISSLQMLNAQPAEGRKEDVTAGDNEGRCRRQHRRGAADHPAADRPGDDLDHGHLRRQDAPLVAARVLVGYGVVIGLAVWAAFKLSGRIACVLGSTGINVMTRLMA